MNVAIFAIFYASNLSGNLQLILHRKYSETLARFEPRITGGKPCILQMVFQDQDWMEWVFYMFIPCFWSATAGKMMDCLCSISVHRLGPTAFVVRNKISKQSNFWHYKHCMNQKLATSWGSLLAFFYQKLGKISKISSSFCNAFVSMTKYKRFLKGFYETAQGEERVLVTL